MQYVALLRGINVGGNKKVPMAELTELCIKLGFTNVHTLLASGNVVLEANATSCEGVKTMLKQAIEAHFGFPVPVICKTMEEIEKLIANNPFATVHQSKDTKLYCTFTEFDATGEIEDNLNTGFSILSANHHIICSTIDLSKIGTVDFMKILEDTYGKTITTRTWNTVVKIGKLAA